MIKLSKSALIVAAAMTMAVGAQAATADDVRTSNLESTVPFYGIAGGPVGADRIKYLFTRVPTKEIGIAMDAGVVERTNMPRDRDSTAWGVTYDKGVQERTNMPSREVQDPVQAATTTNVQ